MKSTLTLLILAIAVGPVLADELPTKKRHELTGLDGDIISIAFSPNGKTLATASGGRLGNKGTVRLWDVATGAEARVKLAYEGASGLHSVTWSPNGKLIAVGYFFLHYKKETGAKAHGHISLFEVATGQELVEWVAHEGATFKVAFLSDTRLVSSGTAGSVRLWDVPTAKPAGAFDGLEGEVRAMSVSVDRSLVAAANRDGKICIWDAATGKVKHKFGGLKDLTYNLDPICRTIDISPRGDFVATGDYWGNIVLWNTATGKRERNFRKENGDSVSKVAFLPDGKHLMASVNGATTWEFATGKEVGNQKGTETLAVSADGSKIATGSNGTITLWGR